MDSTIPLDFRAHLCVLQALCDSQSKRKNYLLIDRLFAGSLRCELFQLTRTFGLNIRLFVVFYRNGEQWQRIRAALAPKVMRPKVLEENIDNFNAVTKDAVERMVQVRDSNGEVPDLEGELSKWSTEGKAIDLKKNNYS